MSRKLFNTIQNEIHTQRYFYLLLLAIALVMMITLQANTRGADARSYLRWTHSITFDQDIHLYNNVAATGGSYHLTPTGYVFELANIGTALLWSPFYAIASFFLSGQSSKNLYPADSIVQLIWLNFSSWLYPVLGGLLIVGALRRFFSPLVLAGAIIAVLGGTPVLFYMITFPMSAHPAQIFLASLLLYLWLSPQQLNNTGEVIGQPQKQARWQSNLLHYVALGVVCGWLMLVASYNIVFFLIPGFLLLKDLVATKRWQRPFIYGLGLGAGGFIGFVPQMIVWWFLFGSPFYSPYSGQLFWSDPYLLETLFSTFHGLFFYAPVLLLVIPGLWQWRRQNGWAALGIASTWLALTYIVSINVAWWAGTSFGNRYFLTLSPFFVVGLASFLQRGQKWAAILVGAGTLWTVGLYLQYLNGIGFTSDSIVYPAAVLAYGQLTAWGNVLSIVPQLVVDRPWHLAPAAVLPILIGSLLLVSRLLYGQIIVRQKKWSNPIIEIIVISFGLAVILFVLIAGFRGNQARAALEMEDFYDQPHSVIRRQTKELAGKAGLVTRALYHSQTNQPEKAVADLKLAAELWQQDDAERPQRLYLGPKESVSIAPPVNLNLDYLGQARLIGYRITAIDDKSISGELFWEKLTTDKSGPEIRPIVRAFDQAGLLRGGGEIDFPFPAHYLPVGSIFKDNFYLEYAAPANDWLWLEVVLADASDLPKNERGEPQTGFIASLIPAAALTPPPPAGAARPGPVIQLALPVAELEAGQMLPLQWNWQNADRLSQDSHLQITLADPAGQTLVQQEYPLLTMEQGNQVDPGQPTPYQTLCLRLPDSLPPGEYSLMARFQTPAAGRLLDAMNRPVDAVTFPLRLNTGDSSGPTSSICQLIEANFTRNYQPSTPQFPLKVLLTNAVELAGFDYFVIPGAETILGKVILHWRILKNVASNYLVSIQLLNEAGQPVAGQTGPPQHGFRPSSTWLQGECLLDEHEVSIPPLPPGRYRLILALIDESSGQPVQLSADQLIFTLQEIEIP